MRAFGLWRTGGEGAGGGNKFAIQVEGRLHMQCTVTSRRNVYPARFLLLLLLLLLLKIYRREAVMLGRSLSFESAAIFGSARPRRRNEEGWRQEDGRGRKGGVLRGGGIRFPNCFFFFRRETIELKASISYIYIFGDGAKNMGAADLSPNDVNSSSLVVSGFRPACNSIGMTGSDQPESNLPPPSFSLSLSLFKSSPIQTSIQMNGRERARRRKRICNGCPSWS